MSDITAILLAAGHGTRMKSDLIKVMHPIAGKPMIGHIVDNMRRAGLDDIVVVVGYQQERIRAYLGDRVRYAVQSEQLGTGHAVLQAADLIDETEGGHVLVMYGDNPFIGPELIQKLIRAHAEVDAAVTLLTAEVADPGSLGRILRDPETGAFLGSVEFKDATPEQRRIREIWPGVALFRRKGFTALLRRLDRNNAQREVLPPPGVGDPAAGGGEGAGPAGRFRGGGAGAQRPGGAGPGRGKAAQADQRASHAQRGHHHQPRRDLHRRGRGDRARHGDLALHLHPRQDRDRPQLQDRADDHHRLLDGGGGLDGGAVGRRGVLRGPRLPHRPHGSPAPRLRARGRSGDRQLRRAEEGEGGPWREVPPPRLSGRCRHRRRSQHRRRHDHRKLQRR